MHVLGVYDVKENNIGILMPDKVSQAKGSANGYEFCNRARTYTLASGAEGAIQFQNFKWKDSVKEML